MALLAGTIVTAAGAAPYLLVVGTTPGDGTIQTINGTLTIVDSETNRALGPPIVVEPLPNAIATAKANDRVYVLNQHNTGNGSVSVVSMTTSTVIATIPVGEVPKAILLSPDDHAAYVLNNRSGTVSVIDLARNEVTREVKVYGSAVALAVSPDGRTLYVPEGGAIVAVDTATFDMRFSGSRGNAANLVPSPDGDHLYVVNTDAGGGTFGELIYPGNSVSVFDTATNDVVARIPVGAKPFAMAISSDGKYVYVANQAESTISVISTKSRTESGRFPISYAPTWAVRALAVSADGARLFVGNETANHVEVYDALSGGVLGRVNGISLPSAIGVRGTLAASGEAAPRPVVEFYNARLDHYFMSQDVAEIADLDQEVHPGWRRTGLRFYAFEPGRGTPAAKPVCRFYGIPDAGLDSHFYSAVATECAEVTQKFATSWVRESAEAFKLEAPDPSTGACPAETVPIYRVWNRRIDSNHRYAISVAMRNEMIARGYVSEGYGPLGTAMCSPSAP